MELAKSLVGQLAAPFKPEAFEDTYRANVERLIEQKRKGQKITTVKQPGKAPVIDLMEALKRSLKASQKSKRDSGTTQSCLRVPLLATPSAQDGYFRTNARQP